MKQKKIQSQRKVHKWQLILRTQTEQMHWVRAEWHRAVPGGQHHAKCPPYPVQWRGPCRPWSALSCLCVVKISTPLFLQKGGRAGIPFRFRLCGTACVRYLAVAEPFCPRHHRMLSGGLVGHIAGRKTPRARFHAALSICFFLQNSCVNILITGALCLR